MIVTSTESLTREHVARTLRVYLSEYVLGDRTARISERDDRLGDIFSRTTNPLGRNAAALEFATFVAQTFTLPFNEVASYDPNELNIDETALLIYDRVRGGKR